jgi:hypothetical protein
MQIKVIEIKDLENGVSEVILDMDDEAKKLLINEGFISALTNGIASVEKLWKEEADDDSAK